MKMTPNAVEEPVYRCLRGYALDPSLSQKFLTAPISEIVFKVPWEHVEPGPVGKYLEVIDYDPSAKSFYAPVDLNELNVVARDGLRPSEGTPQFHQQMVYAVASMTIDRFERALGRKTLWSPGPPREGATLFDDSHFVEKLRIYPHALREANAYYSPTKKALLFGYFPASEDDPGDHIPGGMVFSCLSHDIIAHETTHALLDGLHSRLNRATNHDMLAFHEAFADIVALLQHFTFRDILRHQIGQTRGDIRDQENLLGQLATQFGRATGSRTALRDAIGRFDGQTGTWTPHVPDPKEYDTVLEPHARGAILVGAVFDAFMTIYSARTSDLLRLYTGGTGVLPQGTVHPDLVNRLSDEASKAAAHVLTMCVRALDYCPPVDLTFGEYLRAVITADSDIVPDDDRNYRIAFVEAFRRRGLYPRDVKTLSTENLRWRGSRIDELRPSDTLVAFVGSLREHAHRQQYARDRREIFDLKRETRKFIHDWLAPHLQTAEGPADAKCLGLDPGRSFEVHAAHFATRVGPDGNHLFQLIVHITQSVTIVDAKAGEPLRFDGGCVLIADLQEPSVSYCIRKAVTSQSRRARQQRFVNELGSLRRTYLGIRSPGESTEPFAMLHRGMA
ncbi:MAG: hypothetical protein ABIY52_19105 [Gemmatimonadaceae bacterium]